MFKQLTVFWQRTDAQYSVGICRIFVYWAVWDALQQNTYFFPNAIDDWLATKPPSLWQPHGLAYIFSSPPSPTALWLICALARVSTLAAIVGLGGRISQVASSLSLSLLVAITVSWEPYWSHGWNVNCLVALAFMFAKGGAFSLDNLIRRLLGRKPEAIAPLWPVLLAQSAVALFLFAAFYAKLGLLRGEPTVAWVFSDNIRNAITLPYSLRGYPMPEWLLFVVSHPPLYIAAAFAHMFMQGVPILAVFTTNPYARLFEGSMFALGTALLYLVMTLGVWSWFLLCAVFIDWEYFIGRTASVSAPLGRFATTYCAFFLALFVVASFVSANVNQLYPFSPMDFYSAVLDRVSIRERVAARSFLHKNYIFWMGDALSVQGDGTRNDYRMFSDGYDYALGDTNNDKKKAYLTSLAKTILAESGYLSPYDEMVSPWAPWRYFPPNATKLVETDPQRLEVWVRIYSIPAAPDVPTDRKLLSGALLGIFDYKTSTVRTASATVEGNTLRVSTLGFDDNAKIEILYFRDPTNADEPQTPNPLSGQWSSPDIFAFKKGEDVPWSTVIRVTEEREATYEFYGPFIYSHHGKIR